MTTDRFIRYDGDMVIESTFELSDDALQIVLQDFYNGFHTTLHYGDHIVRVYHKEVGAVSPGSLHLQKLVAEWRLSKPTLLPPTQVSVAAKLAEECGEFVRAVIGELEGRSGRGDIQQEAAQVIVVLLAYFGIHYPDVDLYQVVTNEVNRLLSEVP